MSTANTLTNLIPDVYAALNVVSRELTGLIPAVMRDSTVERAAVNQTVRIPAAPSAASGVTDITPGVTPPDDGNQTFTNGTLTISKSRRSPIRWNGEEQRGVNFGPGYLTLKQNQIAESIRALCNEVETDLASLYSSASRAYGTAGTTPFASDLTDPANVLKILLDNGAPTSDLQLVIDTAAGAKMRSLAQLTKANEAGSTDPLRNGVLLDLDGFKIRESAKIKKPTAGTGSGYLINNGAGYSVGDTALTVDTGSGTILAGDVITIGSGTDKYVVASALSANVVTIAAPGLMAAVADNDAVTVVAAARRNMAFSRSALILATRLPALPEEGDMAEDRTTIVDPLTGLAFELAMYKQYRQVQYELAIAWGYAATKPNHAALLLG